MSELSETKTNLKKLIIQARNEALVNKNFEKSIQDLLELANKYDVNADYFYKQSLALAYFENRDYANAAKVYYEADDKYQAGYCELLMGNLDAARELWSKAPDSSAVEWGRCLIDMINFQVKKLPSFLQIRNNLEVDIGYLIQAQQFKFAQNLIDCVSVMVNINLETYKFIGRSLLHNDYPQPCVKFLLKGRHLLPQDPEAYFHLGQYSFAVEAYKEGKQYLKQCLSINKNYSPAKALLAKIEAKLKLKNQN